MIYLWLVIVSTFKLLIAFKHNTLSLWLGLVNQIMFSQLFKSIQIKQSFNLCTPGLKRFIHWPFFHLDIVWLQCLIIRHCRKFWEEILVPIHSYQFFEGTRTWKVGDFDCWMQIRTIISLGGSRSFRLPSRNLLI